MISGKNNFHKEAMLILKSSNIFASLYTSIKWILNPDSALKLARKIYKDVNLNKIPKNTGIYAIGYLNEFFYRYLSYKKSIHQIAYLNEVIESDKISKNKIANTLTQLRKIRLALKNRDKLKRDQIIKTTQRLGVSRGTITGIVRWIRKTNQFIPQNTIGVFSTSGTKFTNLFKKCDGIVFLNGAITSHGAIIAREFKIPAIIDPKFNFDENQKIKIDGLTGVSKAIY